MTIKVLIVEDEPEFMFRLVNAVASDDALQLVGSASTEEAGADIFRDQRPDTILISCKLINVSSSNIVRQAAQQRLRCDFIISTMFSNNLAVFHGIRAGATDYLLMDSSIEQIVNCIKEQALGRASITPWIARQILAETKALAAKPTCPALSPDNSIQSYNNKNRIFTPQENEVLKIIAAGNLRSHASDVLGISHEFVSCTVKNIYKKSRRSTCLKHFI